MRSASLFVCRSTPTRNYTSSDLAELLAFARAQVVPAANASVADASPSLIASAPVTEAALSEAGAPLLEGLGVETPLPRDGAASVAPPLAAPPRAPVAPAAPETRPRVETVRPSAVETHSEEYAADAMLHHWRTVGESTTKLIAKGPPRVPILCLFSHGKPTPGRITYGGGGRSFDAPLGVDADDGDGTVALRSLRLCAGWSKRLQGRLKTHAFANVSHFDMLRDPAVVDAVLEQLQQDVLKPCTKQGCMDAAGYFSAYW